MGDILHSQKKRSEAAKECLVRAWEVVVDSELLAYKAELASADATARLLLDGYTQEKLLIDAQVSFQLHSRIRDPSRRDSSLRRAAASRRNDLRTGIHQDGIATKDKVYFTQRVNPGSQRFQELYAAAVSDDGGNLTRKLQRWFASAIYDIVVNMKEYDPALVDAAEYILIWTTVHNKPELTAAVRNELCAGGPATATDNPLEFVATTPDRESPDLSLPDAEISVRTVHPPRSIEAPGPEIDTALYETLEAAGGDTDCITYAGRHWNYHVVHAVRPRADETELASLNADIARRYRDARQHLKTRAQSPFYMLRCFPISTVEIRAGDRVTAAHFFYVTEPYSDCTAQEAVMALGQYIAKNQTTGFLRLPKLVKARQNVCIANLHTLVVGRVEDRDFPLIVQTLAKYVPSAARSSVGIIDAALAMLGRLAYPDAAAGLGTVRQYYTSTARQLPTIEDFDEPNESNAKYTDLL